MLGVWFAAALLAMSLVTFAACGWDKWCALHDHWRIRERSLYLLSILGGGWGLFLGMLLFRHKIRYLRFWIITTLSIALQMLLLGGLLSWQLWGG